MISFVAFKWRPAPGYRSAYGPEQVNTLRRMVARHYAGAHRFVCVTDDAAGLDPEVEVVPLWTDHAELSNPSWKGGPNCYRRLRLFAPEAPALLGVEHGDRMVCMDLDLLLCADLAPLFDRPEDFVAWRNPDPLWPYNGSLWMLRAGTRPHVWTSFDPERSPAIAHAAGCRGSDQGWMSYALGRGEATWGPDEGVYSYQMDILRRFLPNTTRNRFRAGPFPLPAGARVVSFHGASDPWDGRAVRVTPWIAEHYW